MTEETKLTPDDIYKLSNGQTVTYEIVQRFISAVALKFAPEHGLSERDFRIDYLPSSPFNCRIYGGVVPRAVVNVYPLEKHFLATIHNTLENIKILKHSTAIDTLANINARQEWVRETANVNTNLFEYPRFNASEVKVEMFRVVRVTHKATGLISVREAREARGASWNKLNALARDDLKNLLDLYEKLKLSQEEGEQ